MNRFSFERGEQLQNDDTAQTRFQIQFIVAFFFSPSFYL